MKRRYNNKGPYRKVGNRPKHCLCKVWVPTRFGRIYIPKLRECRDCGSCMGPHTIKELWLDQVAVTQL